MMKKERKTVQWNAIVLYAILILTTVVFIAPFVYMSLGSFKHVEEIYTTRPTLLPKRGLHLGGYRELIEHLDIIRITLNSAIVSGTGTLLSLFFCSLAGFAFAKFRFVGRELLFYFLIGSMMIPFYGIVIPLFIVVRILHWTDTYQALIIPWIAMPFGIFLMRQYISGVPDELIDAATVDGASNFGIYYEVVVPVIRPGLIVYGFIHFMFYWSFLFWPLVVISKEEMYTLPLALANVFSSDPSAMHMFSWTAFLAAATTAAVPALVIFFVFQRYIVSGIMMGSIK